MDGEKEGADRRHRDSPT